MWSWQLFYYSTISEVFEPDDCHRIEKVTCLLKYLQSQRNVTYFTCLMISYNGEWILTTKWKPSKPRLFDLSRQSGPCNTVLNKPEMVGYKVDWWTSTSLHLWFMFLHVCCLHYNDVLPIIKVMTVVQFWS